MPSMFRHRTSSRRPARALAMPLLVLTLTLLGAAGAVYYALTPKADSFASGAVLFNVVREDFESTITESGDLESSSSLEIRCQVPSRGAKGTRIIWVAAEGTRVKKGELIVQLDDSVLQQELIQQEIQLAQDRAVVIQSTSDLETAKRILFEYENGTFEQEKSVIESELFLARENLRRAIERARYSERLNARGFNTPVELEADRFAVDKARKDVTLSEQKLRVFTEYTRERMIVEYQAGIDKGDANLEAAQHTLRLSQQQHGLIQQQLVNCRIQAPGDGMFIYHSENDRREQGEVIEEGFEVREGQIIGYLPDPTQMRVVTLVNDSKIALVQESLQAWIELDTEPGVHYEGVVDSVAAFPLPRRWFQAPLDYKVNVRVLSGGGSIRPGLRAKVRIVTASQPNVVQAPLTSIVRRNDRYYVLVAEKDRWRPQPVEVGADNDKRVIVTNGLSPGDMVAVNPERFLANIDFPGQAVSVAAPADESPSTPPDATASAEAGAKSAT